MSMSLSGNLFSRFVVRKTTTARPRGRRGILWAVAVSSAVIVYFGPDLVSEVTDRSYIRLLSWPMQFVQEAALEELAERRSGRALPRMIDMFRGRERLATQSSEAVGRFGEVAVPACCF